MDPQTYQQTDKSDFIGRCRTNVERPKMLTFHPSQFCLGSISNKFDEVD